MYIIPQRIPQLIINEPVISGNARMDPMGFS